MYTLLWLDEYFNNILPLGNGIFLMAKIFLIMEYSSVSSSVYQCLKSVNVLVFYIFG